MDASFDPHRFFDTHSRFLETSETGPWLERLNARYFALVHSHRHLLHDSRVLDLASHDGRFTFAALQNGARHVVGIEHSSELVEKSYENLAYYGVAPDRYDFVLGDLFTEIDEVGHCDVVFCFGILYHINDHMLLFSKIAALEPQYVIVDSRISQLAGSVIELRSPLGASPPPPGADIEGQPSQAGLEAMLSYFGWRFDYFDWAASGLATERHLADYRGGSRVSVLVTCYERPTPAGVRESAVREVLERQQSRQTQWLTIKDVASRFGLVPQVLRFWVRRAEAAPGSAASISRRA